jgi:hypothetical protein
MVFDPLLDPSRPVWARGLKYEDGQRKGHDIVVASRVGAGIEIT